MDNRRHSVRIAARLDFRYQVNEMKGIGFIDDLSETGAWIDTQQPLPVDTELDFSFTLPAEGDQESVTGRATVVRVEPVVGMALAFRDLDEETRGKIRFYVASVFFDQEGEETC